MCKATVIIVTYQSRNTIGLTLDALKNAYDAGLTSVIIVDNVSIDGTAEFILNNYPWVNLVRNTVNVGFGRGCNIGAEFSKTPYVMFLNPDAVLELKSLKILLDFMDHNPNAGMCGPVLKDSNGERRFTNILPNPWKIIINPIFGKWIFRVRQHQFSSEESAITEWLYGACMLLRKDIFDSIDYFDPRFFLYFEETDLCHRIRKSGYEIWIVGKAICEHVNAASAKESKSPMIGDTIQEHYFKSRFYYLVKHFGWIRAICAELGEIIFMGIRVLLDLTRGKLYKPFFYRIQAPIMQRPPRIGSFEKKDKICF